MKNAGRSALEILEARAAQAAENRAAMPIVAAMVEELRSIFGPGIRVIHAEEAGRTLASTGFCSVGADFPSPSQAGKGPSLPVS